MNRPLPPLVEEPEEEQQMPPVPRTPSPQEREVPPAPPSAPERPKRTAGKPRHIYEEAQRKEKERLKAKEKATRPKEKIPQPSEQIPRPSSQPQEHTDTLPSISPTPSELDIEEGLVGEEPQIEKLCWDGGVSLLSFLLAKAISPIAEAATTNPKDWVYKDIARLPQLEQKEWENACLQELEALKRRDVFELVMRPTNRKVIKNRWVFDVKTHGRKK